MNLSLEDISKYTPKIGLGRIVLDDLRDYIPKILKGVGTTISTLALVYSLSACPLPKEEEEEEENGAPSIVEKEAEGAKIIYEEAAKRAGLTTTYNTANEQVNVGGVTFIPDVYINGGAMYGEFSSSSDGLTTQQKAILQAYNAKPGDPTGKVILADPDTYNKIKSNVNTQLDDFGF